jgi:FkbM family methyltransferase
MKNTIVRAVTGLAKPLLETLTGCKVQRFGGRSIAVIDQRYRADAWFSYEAQLRTIIEGLGIDLIIDVGANEGQFAREIRSFYRGTILSFEPVSSAFAKLASLAASDPDWHARNFALGSRPSRLTINVAGETAFSSLLKSNEYCQRRFGDESVGTTEEMVVVRRIDDVLAEEAPAIAGRRILVKMDTQGYDMEVFRGLGERLESVVAIQSEVSLIPIYDGMPHWTDTISLYEREGFGVAGFFPVTRDSGRVIEYDCLLIRGVLLE